MCRDLTVALLFESTLDCAGPHCEHIPHSSVKVDTSMGIRFSFIHYLPYLNRPMWIAR